VESARVFAYGTLEVAALVEALTGRSFPRIEAVLEGFARSMVRGQSYPGIAPEPGARTSGVLYLGVDAEALALLDRYEGPLYERRGVRVATCDGERVAAQAWVIAEERRHLLGDEPWDRARFEAHDLARYLEACGRSRRHAPEPR
jgi:gamma-glutamylcyclotransferase (GGCT)/AIG2-like uncharacterized protein YtfP